MNTKKSIPNKEDYHNLRLKSRGFRYRLFRRTKEVAIRLKKYKKSVGSLLDIGTADALMLSSLQKRFNIKNAVGIDLTKELLEKNKNKNLKLLQADCLNLPFKNNSFDVVTAIAVIEHVASPSRLLKEVHRVLKKDGIVILTSPDPFWDSIADRFVYKSDVGGHVETFNLNTLRRYLKKQGFKTINAEKFMFSPIGMPLQLPIEKILKALHLDFFLCNQIIVGKVKK